jgi:hypothetical protein
VENLWMRRANPVEISTANFFLRRRSRGDRAETSRSLAPSRSASLVSPGERRRIHPRLSTFLGGHNNVKVHRFEELIGGRAYQIEVTPVSNRWRAQLRRLPGMPTAMMPFYGQTPDEAARQLAQWLALAHSRMQVPQATAASS